jgi:hypothetical protein
MYISQETEKIYEYIWSLFSSLQNCSNEYKINLKLLRKWSYFSVDKQEFEYVLTTAFRTVLEPTQPPI